MPWGDHWVKRNNNSWISFWDKQPYGLPIPTTL